MDANHLEQAARGRGSWMARFLKSEATFCVFVAALLVTCRLLFFDYQMYFRYQYIPNHDMMAAAPFFVTNAHAMRTTGDLAWWNPISYGGHGYAQYYQSFLSPLAPTTGHLTFVVWLQLVRLLGQVGVTFPEYLQFLTFTYVVLPFLTFLCFAAFARLLFRRRCTVVLVTAAYALSGIGLWNSAWFYFQESFTLFFFLAAWVAVLQRPNLQRALVLLMAVLVQATSFNYWTIYNSWFILICLGTYCAVYRSQVVRCWYALCRGVSSHRSATAGLTVLSLTMLILWGLILSSTVREQAAHFARHGSQAPGRYSSEEALKRVQETRWYTVELFNPKLDRALESYKIVNPMHNARYIGIVFLPLLLLLPFYTWRRLERWLAMSAAGVLCVCLAPPFLLAAWKITPGMDRIIHLFYFYTHFWQTVLVMLGGACLDRLLRGTRTAEGQRLKFATYGLVAIAGVVLLIAGLVSPQFGSPSATLEAITRGGVLLLVFSGLLLQLQRVGAARRLTYAGILVAIGFTDLSRYFLEVSQVDHQFTKKLLRPEIHWPLSSEVAATLKRPWPPGDPGKGFEGGVSSCLPMQTEFWPSNYFMRHTNIDKTLANPNGRIMIVAASPAPVRFFPTAEAAASDEAVLKRLDSPKEFFDKLFIHGEEPGRVEGQPSMSSAEPSTGVMIRWGYNDFSLEVTAPTDGWLLLHQFYDPLWRVKINGHTVPVRRANMVRMAVPVPPGKHLVKLSYRPLGRRLFWPACWLLEGTLLVVGAAAFLSSRRLRLPLATSPADPDCAAVSGRAA
jgi:Bacterial membrane protein YfhO